MKGLLFAILTIILIVTSIAVAAFIPLANRKQLRGAKPQVLGRVEELGWLGCRRPVGRLQAFL
jgi:hypothetical protein